jgi:hypothetical protein
MRFKVTGDHRKVLEKQKFIEFEDLFTPEQLDEVSKHVDQVLAQRTRQLIDTQSSDELYKVGRDLWRDDKVIENFSCNRGLAGLAAQLFHQKALHLAFDQALRTTLRPGFIAGSPATIQQRSCIQPLAGSVLIQLSGTFNNFLSMLPKKRENIVVIAPGLIIPWEIFFQEPQHSFLLITYAPSKALYISEKTDIHVHGLKKLGYAFGDNLNTDRHPLLYK